MNQLMLGPYKVGSQPWSVVYTSYDEATGRRRSTVGAAAKVVLVKPDKTSAEHNAQVISDDGDILFQWPDSPFDQAGNWGIEFWISDSQRVFCADTFSFRVAPSALVPSFSFSQPDP